MASGERVCVRRSPLLFLGFSTLGHPGLEKQVLLVMNIFDLPVRVTFRRFTLSEHDVNTLGKTEDIPGTSTSPPEPLGMELSSSEAVLPRPHPHPPPPAVHAPRASLTITLSHPPSPWTPPRGSLRSFHPGSDCGLRHTRPWGPPSPQLPPQRFSSNETSIVFPQILQTGLS